MELVISSILLFLLSIFLLQIYSSRVKRGGDPKSPPGKSGWPLIGESLEFLSNTQKGHSEKFFFKRMAKYSGDVFKTCIVGDHYTVLCGAAGNKFLFSKGNKLVRRCAIMSVRKLYFPDQLQQAMDGYMRSALLAFLKPSSLMTMVRITDSMAQEHLEDRWSCEKVIKVYPSLKNFAFSLACRLFMSVEDQEVVKKLLELMEMSTAGIQSLPIDLPGTRLNQARRARSGLVLQIQQIVEHQRATEESSNASDSSGHKNLLSYVLHLQEGDAMVAAAFLGLLFASYETISSVVSLMMKVMADHPHVYQRVYQENMEVRAKKRAGEGLSWEDTHKMRYTWNVAREVMRLYPVGPFLTREAIADFTYAGYHIPKGSKLMTSIYATHKDPKYFPEPEKFDPGRFEGDGPVPYAYVPFGGGPNMCPGANYGQAAVLVFIHNVVTRFEWEALIPNEEIIGIPFSKPEKGLPVLLRPHHRH